MALACNIDKIKLKNRRLIKSSEKKQYFDYVLKTQNISVLNKFKTVTCNRISDLTANDIPQKNETTFILTKKNINSSEILEIINAKHKIINLYLAFSSINKTGINNCNKYHIKKIITNGVNQHDGLIYDEILIKPSHLRYIICECENDNYISCISTANLSISSRNETYTLENSKEYFDFILNIYDTKKIKENFNIKIPKENEKFNYVSINEIDNFDFIRMINSTETIEALSFMQHGGGKKGMVSIEEIIKKANKTTFFISDLTQKMIKSTFEQIVTFQNRYDAEIKIENTHSKNIFIKTNKNYYVIISTANFDSKTKIEHTTILNNKKVYDFFITFANNFFIKY